MVEVDSGAPAEGDASIVTMTGSGRVVGGRTSSAATLICTSVTVEDMEEIMECSWEMAPKMDCRDT